MTRNIVYLTKANADLEAEILREYDDIEIVVTDELPAIITKNLVAPVEVPVILISTPSGEPGYFFKCWAEMAKASEEVTFSEVSDQQNWDPKDEWVDIVGHTGDRQTRHVLDYDAITDVLTVEVYAQPAPPPEYCGEPRRGGKGRGRGRGRADWNKTNRGY
jgi:hypothetical protein